MKTLTFLLEKEFKQFFRDPFMPKMVVIFPVIIMLIIPLVANLDFKNIDICIVDHDHSGFSRLITDKISHSSYFILKETPQDYKKAMEAMDKRGMKYDINEGDGAFYGPKIDFKVKDAIGRTWQCATIQLDFNLPERFGIKYQDKDGSMKTPVMLHRVIFGSMERFHGILIEHYAGAFPAWLAPNQVTIVPISNDKHADYAEEVYNKMRAKGIRVQLDDRSESMNYKIREALQQHKVPYVCVVGDKEKESNSLAIRKRGVGQVGTFEVDEFINKLLDEIQTKGVNEIGK